MPALAFELLRALSDGDFHSPEELAARVGRAPIVVARAVKGLDAMGVTVRSVDGRGYRLLRRIQWLNRDAVLAALGEKRHLVQLEIVDEIASTNTALMERAIGAPRGTCLVAEWQSRGRGRRGRQWLSSPGGALTFSLLWRFPQATAGLSGLSLAVGVALVRALATLGVGDVKVKWPNDLVHHHHKIAGILTELRGDLSGPTVAVIGVGLNVALNADVREKVDQAVTDLAAIVATLPERNYLLARLISHICDVLAEFESAGFAAFKSEWMRANAHADRMVNVLLPDGTCQVGRMQGVREDGSLVLITAGGERRYALGEVSLSR